jgi:exodeoxyribonuclease V alpha subunit
MDSVRGKVLSVMRRRGGDGWGIAELLVEGQQRPVKIVGNIGAPESGQHVIAHGEWKSHPTYGKQFDVSELILDLPQERFAIHKWLMTNGCTTNQASKLIDEYKDQLFPVLEEKWHNLHMLHKISLETVTKQHVAATEMISKRDVFLQGMNLGLKAPEIGLLWRRHFEPNLQALDETEIKEAIPALWLGVTRDPWLVLFFQNRFPFRRVSAITAAWKTDPRDVKRVSAALVESLRGFARDGHVGAPEADVVAAADTLLYEQAQHTFPAALFDEAQNWVINNKYVVRREGFFLLRYLDDAEQNVATCIWRLLLQKRLIDEHRSIEGSGDSSTANPE